LAEYDAMIIGGGAAGLMAAARLAGGGLHVALIEQSDRVGRKILATGNGRCNVLNMRLGEERYFSRDIDKAMAALSSYPPDRLIGEFGILGLLTREEDDGRVYPLSGQAASVLDVLRLSCDERGVETLTASPVMQLAQTRFGWRARLCDGREVGARRVILACGGRAQPTPPADKQSRPFDALDVLAALGHSVYPPEPVLTALRCDMVNLRGLKGVRARCALTLADEGGRVLRREEGEALFTDYGVSGIAAMQLSRALGGMRHCTLAIDFLPEMSEADTAALLLSRVQGMSPRSCEGFLAGTLNRMLNMCVLRAAGVAPAKPCSELSRDEVNALAKCLKHFNVNVLGGQDFKSAQVMRGGAALDGFDEHLMSRRARGLYACGEMLDVDGECGGYNLMWAWASALTVADGILGEPRGRDERRADNINRKKRR
jgi:predicted Rossmann fold flavoprotein